MKNIPTLLGAVMLLAITHPSVFGGETYLSLQSDPGDPIGMGQSYYYDLSDRLFNSSFPDPNDVYFTGQFVSNLQVFGVNVWSLPPKQLYTDYWVFIFSSVNVSPTLTVGDYENAEAYPYQSVGHPGLTLESDVGNAFSIRNLTGRFQVLQADFSTPGDPHFAIDFEVHLNGVAPALCGQLRLDSDYGVPEPATAALLLAGTIGCVRRRRKSVFHNRV